MSKYRLKNNAELLEDRKKFRKEKGIKLFPPIIYSTLLFVFVSFLVKVDYDKFKVIQNPISWSALWDKLPEIFIFSFAIGFFFYYLPYILGRPIYEEFKLYVCIECGKNWNLKDGYRRCSCGGRFKHINDIVEIQN